MISFGLKLRHKNSTILISTEFHRKHDSSTCQRPVGRGPLRAAARVWGTRGVGTGEREAQGKRTEA